MVKTRLVVLAAGLLVACGGEEEITPVAPQAIAPGTPSGAVPGAPGTVGQPVAPSAVPGVPPTTPSMPSMPAPSGGSNFGTVTLNPGFTPDPTTATGTSGGSVAASTLNPGCRGHISSQPDHLFVAGRAFANLRIMVAGAPGSDPTLVIQGPDGIYRCEDDTEGRNPVWAGPAPAGTYRIWIGSYRAGQNNAYTLGFSELSNVMPSALGGGVAPAANPNPAVNAPAERAFTLRAGFMPDPKVVSGVGGGNMQAAQRNAACRGWIGAVPNHVMTLTTPINFLAVMANSTQDTTLVIQKPDGTFLCDDDGGGDRNPLASGTFAPGVYQIFVGAYEQQQRPAYRLGVSELRSTRPSAI